MTRLLRAIKHVGESVDPFRKPNYYKYFSKNMDPTSSWNSVGRYLSSAINTFEVQNSEAGRVKASKSNSGSKKRSR